MNAITDKDRREFFTTYNEKLLNEFKIRRKIRELKGRIRRVYNG